MNVLTGVHRYQWEFSPLQMELYIKWSHFLLLRKALISTPMYCKLK